MSAIEKRSVTLARHRTSLSLEPLFWTLLEDEARRQGLPLAQIVASIDRARTVVEPTANLSSAVRVYLVERLQQRMVASGAR